MSSFDNRVNVFLTTHGFVSPSGLPRIVGFDYSSDITKNWWKPMTDWTDMSPTCANLAQSVVATTRNVADAVKQRPDWIGGMRFQTIKGHDYLIRFVPGPNSTKISRSIGRRSPDTEAKLVAFEQGRAQWRASIERLNTETAEQARLAKALRLNRVSNGVVDALDRLHKADLLLADDAYDNLFVAGVTALHAYEIERRVIFNAHLVRDVDGPTLDLATCGEIEDALIAVRGVFPDARPGKDGNALVTVDGLTIRVLQVPEDLIPYVKPIGDTVEGMHVLIGRDGRATMVPVLPPYVFASVEAGRGGDDHIARARATAALHGFALRLDDVQEAAMPGP